MKKVLKVLGIVFLVLFIIFIGFTACTGSVINSVNNGIEENKKQVETDDSLLKDILNDMKWDVKTDKLSGLTTFTSTFKNTTNKNFDYIQFNYELIDENGIVVENSFTNITDVKQGKSYKVEFSTLEKFKDYKITITSTAL